MALSLDEALGVSLLDESDDSIHIDVNTRQVTIPESQKLFGVESDDAVEVKHIVIDGRYCDGTDLAGFNWRVNYRNAAGNKNTYLITNVTANADSIEFDWVIRRSAVAFKGSVYFVVCAYKKGNDGRTTPEWNSTLGQGTVLKGLEVDVEDIGGDEVLRQLTDILAQTQDAAREAQDAANRAGQSAAAAEESANKAAQSAQAAETDRKQAAESADNAADSADAAAKSAELAQQVANKNGYAAMAIDDTGHLKLTRTTSLADKLDFAIVDDKNLEVTIYG